MRAPRLILASGSLSRRTMLENAGLSFDINPADIDEESIIENLQHKIPTEELARELAQRKALHISAQYPDALVIGGDQILQCGSKLYSKVDNKEAARARLENELQGKTHQLISAVCVAKGAEIIWHYTDAAHLTMKNFQPGFLDEYIEKAGEALTRSVGSYEFETLGAWLFDSIKGDYFTILGMPLLPLLGFLEQEGIGLS